MPIEGEIDESDLRLRESLLGGEIEGESFDVTLNADGQAIFVEFSEDRVQFDISDMIEEAYEMVHGSDDQ